MTTKLKHWSDGLPADACDPAVEWCRSQPSLAVAWSRCKNGSWMLWLLAERNANRPKIVMAAACCAELALPYAQGDEALAAVQIAVGWADGQLSLEVVRAAAADANAAAYAAAYAADADAADAAYAADAAAYAADAAADAAYAADAAAYATDAAARTIALTRLAEKAMTVIV